MAGGRILVANEDTAAESYAYTVPASQSIEPRSITAVFDGGAVGSAFKPVVSVYSQSGALLARVFPADSIGAGDSAEVTFAPFLGSRSAGATPGGGVNPYSRLSPTAVIPNGSDPTVQGTFYVSMPDNPIPGDDPRSIAFGQGEVRILDDPGVTGTGLNGVYQIGPMVNPVGAFGFTVEGIGSGYTAPGGVPYPAVLVLAGGVFGEAAILVPGATDPDAADYFNRARPDWPGPYAPGDTLFAGMWNVPVTVD